MNQAEFKQRRTVCNIQRQYHTRDDDVFKHW